MIKQLMKLVRALSSNTNPGAIANAFACGVLLGFLPKNNLLWYILFIFIFFLRIQRATFALSVIVFSLLAPLADTLFDTIGFYFLTWDAVRNAYIYLLDIPFVAFTKINNTLVIGSLLFGIVIYVPAYWLCRGFVHLWRKYLADGIRKLKVVQVMKQIPLISKLASLAADR